VYGSDARLVLEPTPADRPERILRSIRRLRTEGSTNVEAGLRLGYRTALQAYRPEAVNRVILCSDGVANTGETSANALLDMIGGYVSEGVDMTALGFGMGNFNDVLLEQLADKGNGFYAYVDTLEEAERLFINELTSSLQTIAYDAKVQVDFNQELVAEYRLLGYENRQLSDDEFRDDSVDAGEIGAGHTATAVYQVRLRPGAEGRIATVQLRWQDADTRQVQEINGNFNTWDLYPSFEESDAYFQKAALVAAFAEVLRASPYTGASLGEIASLARQLARELPYDSEVQEFAELAGRAARLSADE
jgi:Ca-activated chloride channel family protein